MKRAVISLLGCVLALALIGAAGTLQAETDRATQRKQFVAAEKALKLGRKSDYLKLKQSLRDYPLYPYLLFTELKQRLSKADSAQIEQFLQRYAGTPLSGRLRRAWLSLLGKRKQWRQYIAFYQPDNSIKRQCYYLNALLHTGKQAQAMRQVEPLWLNGRSQPDACDPVFAAWRQQGKLTPQLTWQRIELAIDARQIRLARYLGRYLPADQRPWLEQWLAIHSAPKRALSQSVAKIPSPYREKMLLHGIKRLARKDLDAAIQQWGTLADRHSFSDTQRYQAERALARAIIRSDHPDRWQRLTAFTASQDDDYLHELRIRGTLKDSNWKQTLVWLESLPAALQSRDRWRYWKARSYQALGDESTADSIYQRLAKERSYYGFLAADQIDEPYNLTNQPLEISKERIEQIAARPAAQRTYELLKLQRQLDARREWRTLTGDLSKMQLQAAAKLAQQWNWHAQAIFTLARTEYWDDLELRFPVAHRQLVDEAAAAQQLANHWIFAVIRQESAFGSDARSPAGALGLMQLMPATARMTAKRIKQKRPGTAALLTPDTNITLGSSYLKRVLGRLDNNPVLATAAYNAGPHRVRAWLPDQPQTADVWIEQIPFRETRRYVQRVLSYAVIYQMRLGGSPQRIQQLMPQIPAASTVTARSPGSQTAHPG